MKQIYQLVIAVALFCLSADGADFAAWIRWEMFWAVVLLFGIWGLTREEDADESV